MTETQTTEAASIEQKLGITLEPSGGWDDVTDAQLRERFSLDR